MRGKTVRQLEQLVAGKRQGDLPSAAPDPHAIRHALSFEVTADTFALFREALRELRRRSDANVDDDTALLEMARLVLGGPRDEGRASYQVALSVCPECGSGRQPANGQLVPLPPEIVAMAECDAHRIPAIERHAPNDGGTTSNQPNVALRGANPDNSPGGGGPAHVGKRAQQDIPRAMRRAVLQRDERRCRVPGCRNATFLQPRAEEGARSAENLVTVCAAITGRCIAASCRAKAARVTFESCQWKGALRLSAHRPARSLSKPRSRPDYAGSALPQARSAL